MLKKIINKLLYNSHFSRLKKGTDVYFSFNHTLTKGKVHEIIDNDYYRIKFYDNADNSYHYIAKYFKDNELFINERDAYYHCSID